MSVDTIAARLATIQATVTGVTSAFDIDATPNALPDTLLPAFINVPGLATYEGWGSGDISETRLWRMLLFVTPLQRPSDVARKATLVQPFFRRVMTAFVDAQQLNDLTDVQWAWIVEDDGLDVLEYAGVLFAGIEFRISVLERWAATVST